MVASEAELNMNRIAGSAGGEWVLVAACKWSSQRSRPRRNSFNRGKSDMARHATLTR
jgi:hypothetical protein